MALGIAPALEAIRTGIRLLHPACKVFAYLDDIVVIAPSHLALAAHDVVKRAMDEAGLALNNRKTKAWIRDPATQLPEGLPFDRVSTLKVLGSQVAWLDREDSLAPVHDAADPSPILQKARRLAQRISQLLAHGLSARSAFLVLQTFSKSCANHLLRANLETGPWLDELENILHTSLGQVLVTPGSRPETIGPEQAHIASLRTKDGGLAFGGLKHTTPFAFIGSWFLCLKEVASTLGIHSWATFTSKCPSVAAKLQLASGMAVERGACNGTPVNWLHPMEHAIPKMQSLLTKQAAKKQRDKVLELLTDDDACDFQSNGGTGAGAYLLPTPEEATCKPIPDAHFRTSLRDRLLLAVCPPNSTCQHRKADGSLCNAPLDRRGRHARKCKCQGLRS